ncbi:MAG: SPASM domain-containing protein [Bacteroidetes bacterium]|nr:SPASM domain-containing protein [Bacteroidota bacterium]
MMKINKKMKDLVRENPLLSSLAYSLIKKIWHFQANVINYDFPSTINHNSITVKDIKKYNQQRPFGPKKRICYAPFNNLHFQINGEITSCSFNYDFVLGNIHTSTIKEIWNGEKAADFRSTLACFNLEKCASCKAFYYLKIQFFSTFKV